MYSESELIAIIHTDNTNRLIICRIFDSNLIQIDIFCVRKSCKIL